MRHAVTSRQPGRLPMLRDLLSAFVIPAVRDAALPVDVDQFVDDDAHLDAAECSARGQ